MTWAWFLLLLQGAGVTLFVSGASIGVGVPLGLLLALLRSWQMPIVSRAVSIYVSVMRSTPAVTLALLIFFAIPMLGIDVDPLPAAVSTLALGTAAFNCEIWRSGLASFSSHQLDAARAFGMTPILRFRRIVFPQLWRVCLPALVNEMTMLVKASPAISVIGVVEVTRTAIRIGAETYQPLSPIIAATLIYIGLISVLVVMQRIAEQRYSKGQTNL